MYDFTVGVTREPQTMITNEEVCAFKCGVVGVEQQIKLYCKPKAVIGRYVSIIYVHPANNILTLCEVEVFGYKNYAGNATNTQLM